MFVCGGLTTCCRVCSGVVIVARKRCRRSGRHLANALRSPPPPPKATLWSARGIGRPAARRGADLDSRLGEAGLHLRELGLGRALNLAVDLNLLAAGLDLGDDLRHRPGLVHCGEHEAARDRLDARHLRDLCRGALGEGQLRAREEEVVDELLAGLAELREIRDHGLIGLDHLTATAAEPAATAGPALRPVLALGLERHGQIGADARERVERLRLRLVEPTRERRHGDHERDTDGEPEHGQDRAALAPQQLAP